MTPQYVAIPKKPLDYKKIEYQASQPEESENGDIEQPKYVAQAAQMDTNFSGNPVI